MAENSSFPQIPTTVWWGVRSLLNKTPRASISEDMLGAELNVQPAAAKQYVSELKRVGILNDENRATDLANKWRLEDTYDEAVSELLQTTYSEELLTIAPTVNEREKAISWFKRQGLGEGAARNKAATYFLLASEAPGEAVPRSSNGANKAAEKTPNRAKGAPRAPTAPKDKLTGSDAGGSIFPVNLNLQIHISADASPEQIDAIFGSMRKHLGNARLS